MPRPDDMDSTVKNIVVRSAESASTGSTIRMGRPTYRLEGMHRFVPSQYQPSFLAPEIEGV